MGATQTPALGKRERVSTPNAVRDIGSRVLEPTETQLRPAPWRRLALGDRILQARLAINRAGDRYEEEADRIADRVVSMPEPGVDGFPGLGAEPPAVQRMCAECEEEEASLQTKRTGHGGSPVTPQIERRIRSLRGGGRPLPSALRGYFEPRLGRDLGGVRVHTGGEAATTARDLRARAFTIGPDIAFGSGEYLPESTQGRRLLAHELVHTVQQGFSVRRIQRTPEEAEPEEDFTGPLTDREWEQLSRWQERGVVEVEPLTGDPDHNALVVAEAIFCSRALGTLVRSDSEDPLLCILPSVTRADPRVVRLVPQVTARGPIVNWARVDPDQRMLRVMELLVDDHGLSPAGAAGVVGNLWAESGVLPNRIESSAIDTPMRSADSTGHQRDFTAEEVMNRDRAQGVGPRMPGIGLAQWTTEPRRSGLFQHQFQGRQLGASILFNMAAQVDYLVHELSTRFPGVHAVVSGTGVSVDAASDEVVYRFEVPGSILDADRNLLPRTDPAVQTVFRRRRGSSQRAYRVYQEAHP